MKQLYVIAHSAEGVAVGAALVRANTRHNGEQDVRGRVAAQLGRFRKSPEVQLDG